MALSLRLEALLRGLLCQCGIAAPEHWASEGHLHTRGFVNMHIKDYQGASASHDTQVDFAGKLDCSKLTQITQITNYMT